MRTLRSLPTCNSGYELVTGKKKYYIRDFTHFVAYFFVQAVSNGCSSGLIDDAENIKSTNGSSIFSCLALGVIEIGRNSDNCIGDRLWRKKDFT